MEIDETKMEELEEPTFWQKLRNSIIALLFGSFLLKVTPISFVNVFLPNSTFFYVLLYSYATICLLLGWFYGNYFISYLHERIEDWWSPKDLFK
jgi:uncharacterized protein YqhQ